MIKATYVLSQINEISPIIDEGLLDIPTQFMDAFHIFIKRMTLKLLPDVHKHIQEQHPEKHFTHQAVQEGAEITVSNLNPKKIYAEVKVAIREHGLIIGAMIAFWELFEHFILPGILIALGLPKIGILTGSLPVGELIFYPIAFKALRAFKGKEKEIIG